MGSKGPASRGQKRAAKTKARQRRQQSSPSTNNPPTIPADVLEEFETWLTDRELGEHAERVVGLVRSTLIQIARANPGFVATAWTPGDAHFVVDAAERIEDSDPDNGPAAAANIVVTLLELLTFLDESDNWTGSDDDFAHVMEDLTDFVENDPDVLDPEDIELPDVSDADESAALSALPLINGLDAVVARVGTGIPLSEIPELATALSEPEDHDHDHDAVPVDITALDHWATAFASDVLETNGTDIVPGSALDGFTARSNEVLRDVLAQAISHQLTLSDVDISMALSNTFAVQTLLAAMTDDLPLDNEDENYDDLEGEDLRTAQLIDFRVRSLQEQGVLVRVEDSLEVPNALRAAVLAGVSQAEPFGDHDPNEEF